MLQLKRLIVITHKSTANMGFLGKSLLIGFSPISVHWSPAALITYVKTSGSVKFASQPRCDCVWDEFGASSGVPFHHTLCGLLLERFSLPRRGACRRVQTQLRSTGVILGGITFLRYMKTREVIHVNFRRLFLPC